MLPYLFVGTVMGVILSQVTVLGIWVALGRVAPMWRAVVAIAGSSCLGLLLCLGIGELESEWFILVWFLALVTTAVFLIMRWCGYQLVSGEQRTNAETDEMQFSLLQMLGLVTVIAALAAIGKSVGPSLPVVGTLSFGISIAGALGLLALAAAWATLGTTCGPRHLVVLGFVALGGAVLVFYIMEATGADPGSAWAIVFSVYVSCTAATLLAARAMGFRVSRELAQGQGQQGGPSAAPRVHQPR